MTNEQRIAIVERDFLVEVGRGSRPDFWSKVDIRRFLIVEHGNGCLTLTEARQAVVQRFGAGPSRSAISRFWLSLDRFWKARK